MFTTSMQMMIMTETQEEITMKTEGACLMLTAAVNHLTVAAMA